uniref:Leucine-rich repeat and fibronectin type-III domain-containing protein 4 n=1 Tax=Anas platyrhynchos TaxID=8839 RepID=A0A8B9SX36_ANAPL
MTLTGPYWAGLYWLLVPLVVLGAVAGAQRCPPRCLCPAAAPSPTLLCARTGLLAVPPSLDRGAVELRLADNFIGAVGRADFANMSSLVHLTLSRNGLRRLAPGAFADLRALRALHLDGNRLPALSGAQLRGLASLRHLILANNQLAAIEPAAFAAFAATVEDLDLSHNNLPALPWEAVAGMATRPRRRPAGLPRLARLDLTANRRGALPPVPGPPGPSLAAGGNPLHCNCELLWLRRLARPDGLESCASPPPLAGRLLWAVPEEELRAEPPPSPGAAASPAAVLGGAAAAPGLRRRRGPAAGAALVGPRRAAGAERLAAGAGGRRLAAAAGGHAAGPGAFTCVASTRRRRGAARVQVAVLPLPVPRRDGGGARARRSPCPKPRTWPAPGGNESRPAGERRIVAAELTASSALHPLAAAAPRAGLPHGPDPVQHSLDDSLVYRWGPSSRSFVLRDLAAGREYDLCVSALYAEGSGPRRPPPSAPWGCVRFCHGRGEPRLRRPPRPHFLGGTVIIVIGAAIAASVLVFILTPVCSQTNGTHRAPEPEPPPPPLPPPSAPPAPPVLAPLGAPGGARGLFPSHSYPRRARTRRHGSLPRLDAPDALPTLRPSFGSTHWMLESTV